MKRGGSGDSLYNVEDNVVGSSSGSSTPSDFISDDETSADSLFMMSGQSFKGSRSTSRASNEPSRQANTDPLHKYLASQRFRNSDYPLQQRHNILQTPPYQVIGPSDRLSSQFNYIDNVDPAIHASTSYYDQRVLPPESMNSPNVSPLEARMHEAVSNSSLIQDQQFNQRCNNQLDNSSTYRLMPRNRNINHRSAHSSRARVPEDEENFADSGPDESDPNSDFFNRIMDFNRIEPPIANLTRNMNSIAVLMCSNLVECRTLREAMEIVELNRSLIHDITRVVRDAPAYRNYDICNYQIDYSVKESFNPSFWQDREPVVTTADGNCQYHAVSLSLTGSEAYTSEVRLATAVAVIENQDWFDSMLKMIDRGSVIDLVRTIARNYSWGDETTLKAIAVAINRRIFLYTCNIGKKDFEMIKSLSRDELLDAFKEKKYRGGTGIHAFADPLTHVPSNNYIMLFHKSEHFIAVLPTTDQPTMFEPYNPIVPMFI